LLTLYYCDGSSSLASHIALEETGAPYEAQRIDIAKGEHRAATYLAINPRGRVPVLRLEDGDILTENVAILAYLGQRFPEVGLLPQDAARRAQRISLSAFFASSVRVAHRHIRQPHTYTPDQSAWPAIQDVGRKTFFAYLQEIDALIGDKEWLFDAYSVCDPYALMFYWCGVRQKMPVHELHAYTAHKNRMLRRPAARRVLERDPDAGIILTGN
jgi:glutathione S-transferase